MKTIYIKILFYCFAIFALFQSQTLADETKTSVDSLSKIGALPEPAGAIYPSSTLCIGPNGGTVTYSTNPIPGATEYVWIPSGGPCSFIGVSNGLQVTVQYPADADKYNYSISVAGRNSSGTGIASSFSSTMYKPITLGSITGQPIINPNDPNDLTNKVYSVTKVGNASPYIWNVPEGVSFTGQNTNSIVANYPSNFKGGNISVAVVNGSCGLGPASILPVSIPSYNLTLSTNNGTINSSHTGPIPSGTTVTLTAIPINGYKFMGWSGALSGTTNPATLVMDANKSVSASFAPITYSLSITTPTNGTITNNPSGTTFNSGTSVTLTATPAAGYKFTGWTGALSGTTNPATLVMDANKTVSANFAPITYSLSITTPTNGTITNNPSGTTFNSGTSVTLTATPAAGYKFTGWTGALSGTTNPATLVMDANKTVSANFAPITYSLSITTPTNGTITNNPFGTTFNSGTSVTLTATPAAGYRFTGWSGALSGTTNPATLVMNANKTVSATFALITYSLSITATANGNVTSNPAGSTFNSGTSLTLTATPSAGYQFTGWTGSLTGTTNPATLIMNENKSVSATFSLFAGRINGNSYLCIGPTAATSTFTAEGFINPQYYQWIVNVPGASPISPTTNYVSNGNGFTANTATNQIEIRFPTGLPEKFIELKTAEGSAKLPLNFYFPASSVGSIIGSSVIYTRVPEEFTQIYKVENYPTTGSLQWIVPDGITNFTLSNNEIRITFPSSFQGGVLRAFAVNGPCGGGPVSSLNISVDNIKLPEAKIETMEYLSSGNLENIFSRNITSKPVGSLSGNIDIGSSGSASYSIPIFTPPGTAGIQPNVSINYNSSSGIGMLGLGWNLSSTSAIVRTGNNYYSDGKTNGINFDATDKFTLDGNRLIATNGTYGAGDTEYRTEFDQFSKIKSIGTVSTCCGYFIVETKDGRTLEYGKTPDSRIEAQGINVPRIWYLNKVTDKFGNYIKYNYIENSTTGEALLSSIEYTGNESASLTPYNKIIFNYGLKNDPDVSYIKGSKITSRVVLKGIKVYSETSMVREYTFNYILSDGTRLSEIIEKTNNGSSFNSCLIRYSNKPESFPVIVSNLNPGFSPGQLLGDFNGDGRMDIFKFDEGNWQLYLANMEGYNFTLSASGTYSTNSKEFKVADFNGDGMDDVLEQNKASETSYLFIPWFSNGTNLTRSETGKFSFSKSNEIAIGDFNGDGLKDVFIKELDINKQLKDWYIYSCTSSTRNVFQVVFSGNDFPNKIDEVCDKAVYKSDGTIAYYLKSSCYPLYTEFAKTFLDYDGDGKTDLLSMDSEKAIFYKFNGTKFQVDFTTTEFNANNRIEMLAFFNNDNNIDILLNEGSSNYKIIYTTGIGVTSKTIAKPESSYKIGDFNGDSHPDILSITKENDIFKFYVSYFQSGTYSPLSLVATHTDFSYINHIADFNGDGTDDVYFYASVTGHNQMIVTYNGKENHFVKYIANGFNQITQLNFSPLTNSSVYTKGTGAKFPVIDYQGPSYVVSSAILDNGIGGQTTIQYTYSGLKIHLQGRGVLGFTKTAQTNSAINIKAENTFGYNPTYYYSYLLKSETKTTAGAQISVTDYTNSLKSYGNKRIFPYTAKVISKDNLQGITQTTNFVYDDYGNQTEITTDYNGEGNAKTTNTYVAGESWCPSKVEHSIVTKIIGTEAPFVKSIYNTYNTDGSLATSISAASDYNTDTKRVTTSYEYNTFGLLTEVTTAGDGISESRSVSYDYDTKGRFVLKTTNALNQFTESTYDINTGNILTSKDINGLETIYSYDAFGRPNQTTLPDGNIITSSLGWAEQTAPTNAVYYSLSQMTGNNPVKTYYDRLGRSIRQINKSFNGTDIYTDTKYNAKGQLYQVSDPYFNSSTPEWTTFVYDGYGRNTSVAAPTGTTNIAYSGRTTTTTNASASPQQSSSKTINALGQAITATDAGGSITYTYYSSGLPKTVTSPGGAITTMEYDEYGNQTKLVEPNIGTITYTYNAFHQLVSQANNGLAEKTSTLTYDILGRVRTLTENEGTTTYTYDTKTYGKGKLASVSSPGNIAENYAYDAKGRLSSKTETIDGQNFTEILTYDSYSRPSTLTYPSGFAISYHYNANNYMYEIKRTDNNTAIWTAQTMNARGQMEQFKYGNNLVTNQTFTHGFITGIKTGTIQNMQYQWNEATGNLTWRKDAIRNLTENFSYDNLDRLTGISGSNTGSYTYTPNGNIATSTPAGTYTYRTDKPNAVEKVTNPSLIIPHTQQSIDYTSFDKVKQITEETKKLTITYGTDKERCKTVYTEGTKTLTRYYAHGNYEKETGSINRELHYISASTGVVAIYEKGTTNRMLYIHKDHLSSVNIVTNESGAVIEEMSFDAWGRRRNPTNWTYTGIPATHVIERGYTGHEHLDQFGAINMNGRIYDPVTSRFFSPDKLVQAPGFTQSYNRYSYCMNNPLKYTDPSGWYGENTTGGAGEIGADGLTNSQWIYNSSPFRYDPSYASVYYMGAMAELQSSIQAIASQGRLIQDYYGRKYIISDNDIKPGMSFSITAGAYNNYDGGYSFCATNEEDRDFYIAMSIIGFSINETTTKTNGEHVNLNRIYSQLDFSSESNKIIHTESGGTVEIIDDRLKYRSIRLDNTATYDFFNYLENYKKGVDATTILLPTPGGTAKSFVSATMKAFALADLFILNDNSMEDYGRLGKGQGITLERYYSINGMGESTTYTIRLNNTGQTIANRSILGLGF